MPKKKNQTPKTSPDPIEHALEQHIGELLAEEGITPDVIAMVDLEIAFSPVIAIQGETISQAVEAIPTQGGGYLVRHPLIQSAVDADQLKVMRARYLLARNAAQPPMVLGIIQRVQR